jgi:hypothetical protein
VVIGVAVTLCAGYLIGLNNENRDMKLYLNAIKMELEENHTVLEQAAERFRPVHAYSNYLRTHNRKDLEIDSLMAYQSVWHNASTNSFKKNAFEMFKSSGSMRLVKDKELLLSIWSAYKIFDNVEDQTEFFMKEKWVEIKKEIFTFLNDYEIIGDPDYRKILEETKIVPMYDFHIIGVDASTMYIFENALESTKETIEKLEKIL